MITKITTLADAFNAIPVAKVGRDSSIAHAVSHNAVIDVILRVQLPCHWHETTEDLGQIEQRTKSLE